MMTFLGNVVVTEDMNPPETDGNVEVVLAVLGQRRQPIGAAQPLQVRRFYLKKPYLGNFFPSGRFHFHYRAKSVRKVVPELLDLGSPADLLDVLWT